MAGFEVVVRPVVFPNIRPRARQSLPPQDDPEKGIAVIKGNPAQSVGLSDNWSVSTSQSRPQESQRRVDEVVVYQEEEDGTVNKNNFIKTHVPTKIWTVDPSVGKIVDGVFIPNGGYETVSTNYAGVEEAPNIEIKNRDIIKKNPNYKR